MYPNLDSDSRIITFHSGDGWGLMVVSARTLKERFAAMHERGEKTLGAFQTWSEAHAAVADADHVCSVCIPTGGTFLCSMHLADRLAKSVVAVKAVNSARVAAKIAAKKVA